jgi:hypothetical protein
MSIHDLGLDGSGSWSPYLEDPRPCRLSYPWVSLDSCPGLKPDRLTSKPWRSISTGRWPKAARLRLTAVSLRDFSRWIQGEFRDSVLAETIKAIEEGVAATGANNNSIRNELLSAIEARYRE